jgi:hypothetical protein
VDDFRTLRQAAAWLGIAILASEQGGRLVVGRAPSDISFAVGAFIFVVAVFGPAAAAVVIRAIRGKGDDDA